MGKELDINKKFESLYCSSPMIPIPEKWENESKTSLIDEPISANNVQKKHFGLASTTPYSGILSAKK